MRVPCTCHAHASACLHQRRLASDDRGTAALRRHLDRHPEPRAQAALRWLLGRGAARHSLAHRGGLPAARAAPAPAPAPRGASGGWGDGPALFVLDALDAEEPRWLCTVLRAVVIAVVARAALVSSAAPRLVGRCRPAPRPAGALPPVSAQGLPRARRHHEEVAGGVEARACKVAAQRRRRRTRLAARGRPEGERGVSSRHADARDMYSRRNARERCRGLGARTAWDQHRRHGTVERTVRLRRVQRERGALARCVQLQVVQ